MYNINKEKDGAILRKSRSMEGYSELIDRIKRRAADGNLTKDVIADAVTSCIADGFLPDFLEKNAPEVVGMLYKRFTDEEIKELYTTDGYNMGIEQGLARGAQDAKHEMAAAMRADGVDVSLIEKYTGLSTEEIEGL